MCLTGLVVVLLPVGHFYLGSENKMAKENNIETEDERQDDKK
jgi:hypothetical protein